MMDKELFRKKYLGEVKLKNGEHVKFLFPVTEYEISQQQIKAEKLFKAIHDNPIEVKEYTWAVMDDLNLSQFRIVFTAVQKYGKNYWKLTWQKMCEK